KPGSKVIFTTEDKPCPLPLDPAIHVKGELGWDPTDPDESNPWHKEKPVLEATDCLVALGEEMDVSTLFHATDTAGNDISDRVEVTGKVDTQTPGIYRLEARVTDDLGKSATAGIYVRVVAPKN
ncbi:MAG: DUF5011 domain-containing protein, partial [Clostridia bacterium]|nr:DUF5011 domain-containing protein [Clostridia bacterium]